MENKSDFVTKISGKIGNQINHTSVNFFKEKQPLAQILKERKTPTKTIRFYPNYFKELISKKKEIKEKIAKGNNSTEKFNSNINLINNQHENIYSKESRGLISPRFLRKDEIDIKFMNRKKKRAKSPSNKIKEEVSNNINPPIILSDNEELNDQKLNTQNFSKNNENNFGSNLPVNNLFNTILSKGSDISLNDEKLLDEKAKSLSSYLIPWIKKNFCTLTNTQTSNYLTNSNNEENITTIKISDDEDEKEDNKLEEKFNEENKKATNYFEKVQNVIIINDEQNNENDELLTFGISDEEENNEKENVENKEDEEDINEINTNEVSFSQKINIEEKNKINDKLKNNENNSKSENCNTKKCEMKHINKSKSTDTILKKNMKNKSILKYLVKKYSLEQIFEEAQNLSLNKSENKNTILSKKDREKLLALLPKTNNEFNLNEELLIMYLRNQTKKFKNSPQFETYKTKKKTSSVNKNNLSQESIENEKITDNNKNFTDDENDENKTNFNDKTIYGNHYYLRKEKIYSFLSKKSTDFKVRRTFYCSNYRCPARIILFKNNNQVIFSGRHIEHNGISKDELKTKFSGLFKGNWTHIQLGVKNKKNFILYKY